MNRTKKDALIRTFYSMLDRFLPERWSIRVKLCCCILTGGWNFPYPNFVPESRAELEEHFHDLEPESKARLFRWLEIMAKPSAVFRAGAVGAIFVKDSEYYNLSPDELAFNEEEQTASAALARKIHLKGILGPEYYRHGLVFLPESVRGYIASKDFIDAGAFHGESCIVFMEYSPCCVHSFEPSEASRKHFLSLMRKDGVPKGKYCLVPAGLSNEKKTVQIHDSGGSGMTLSNDSSGDEKIQITTVDSYAEEQKLKCVGVIKADVEGMGLALVRGAEKTIRRDRPVLLLSIYHTKEEYYGIYEFLKSLNLNYSFRIEMLFRTIYETTLLAWPAELAADKKTGNE